MGRLLEQEWLRGVMFTLVALGLIAAAVGAWQYFDAGQELSTNRAQQIREAGDTVPLNSDAEAQSLMASDLRRAELIDQQNNALILAGGGLVVLAFGWIGLDLIRSYKRRKAQAPAPETTDISATNTPEKI